MATPYTPLDTQPQPPTRHFPWRLVVIIIAVLIVAVLVVIWLQQRQPEGTTVNNQNGLNTNIPDLPSTFNQIPDQDRDRLTDNQEKELKTNPNSADTDSDQLNDYDEVAIYKTDPLNPDSDGDGFSDGYEVTHGFNPNGEGELLDINKALENQ